MAKHKKLLVLLLFITAACGRDEETDAHRNSGGQGTITSQQDMAFSDVRARTGSEGGMGAVYFTLTNGASEPDTLKAVDSEIAKLTEIHESFEKENGSIGMRKIPSLALNKEEQVRFEPGGYHVMLIRLQEALAPGDTVNLKATFAESGTHNLAVPVVEDP